MVDQLDAPSVTPEPDPSDGHLVPVEPPTPEERQARWMSQLQSMIDDVASAAGPALREVAAKAAELAAKAGEAAGPFAHRAATVTTDVGQRVAARGREIATDLRRAADGTTDAAGDGATEAADHAGTSAESAADAVMPDPSADHHETPTA